MRLDGIPSSSMPLPWFANLDPYNQRNKFWHAAILEKLPVHLRISSYVLSRQRINILHHLLAVANALMQEVKREKKKREGEGKRGEGKWWEKARFLYAGFKTC